MKIVFAELPSRAAPPKLPPPRRHEDAEYADVVPIPFFPTDLPTLEITPVDSQVMQDMARLARRWLWLQPPTIEELNAA